MIDSSEEFQMAYPILLNLLFDPTSISYLFHLFHAYWMEMEQVDVATLPWGENNSQEIDVHSWDTINGITEKL